MSSLSHEIPDAPSDYELLVQHTDSLLDLAKKAYSGELKNKVRHLVDEIDLMRIDDISKKHLKIILSDVQATLLHDASEYYLDQVHMKLKIFKYFIGPGPTVSVRY